MSRRGLCLTAVVALTFLSTLPCAGSENADKPDIRGTVVSIGKPEGDNSSRTIIIKSIRPDASINVNKITRILKDGKASGIDELKPEMHIEAVIDPAVKHDSPWKHTAAEIRIIDSDNGAIWTIARGGQIGSDIEINNSSELIVRPGTTLEFAENTGIVCSGKITAVGARGNPVVFTAKDPEKGWANVALIGPQTSGSRFEWCRFTHGRSRKACFTKNLMLVKFDKDATEGFVPAGGAVFTFNVDAVSIESCVFMNNWGYYGGAICTWGNSAITISSNYFAFNNGGEDGGGVHCVLLSNASITGNYFEHNVSQYGGALHCLHFSKAVIDGNYIAKNTATKAGGGVSGWNSGPVISNNFISDNYAPKEKLGGIAGGRFTPEITGNYCGENRHEKGKDVGIGDEYIDNVKNPADRKDILEALKKSGVLNLPKKLTG